MAGSASKTARRSSPTTGKSATAGQLAAAAATGAVPRLTSLNGGQHCYLADPVASKTRKLATNSAEFDAAIAELSALGLAGRLRAEMSAFAEQYPTSACSTGSTDPTAR